MILFHISIISVQEGNNAQPSSRSEGSSLRRLSRRNDKPPVEVLPSEGPDEDKRGPHKPPNELLELKKHESNIGHHDPHRPDVPASIPASAHASRPADTKTGHAFGQNGFSAPKKFADLAKLRPGEDVGDAAYGHKVRGAKRAKIPSPGASTRHKSMAAQR